MQDLSSSDIVSMFARRTFPPPPTAVRKQMVMLRVHMCTYMYADVAQIEYSQLFLLKCCG